ncbi:hypothetical protein [Clostridium sp. BJN0013]|uniref:hypothetical protein n=1 Tax=Clostridium sp. BJN0013 TaxID=3236840 RepID=UPI0034C61C30
MPSNHYKDKLQQDFIDKRTENLKWYLTNCRDMPTSSAVNDVGIWNVRKVDGNKYKVTFSIDQLITEGNT